MTLTLYITHSDNRAVTKELQTVTTITTIEPDDNVDILGIQCSISYNDNLLNVNYCYCHELNRYYYVTISFNNRRIIYISGTVDVLMSFRDDILKSKATCIRNGGIGKPTYIVDKQLPIKQSVYSITAAYLSGDPLQYGDNRYVLTTLGGV